MSGGIIGVPHTNTFLAPTVKSLVNLAYNVPKDSMWHFYGSSLIYNARERIAEIMFENDKDWVFFLDSDMTPQPDTLTKLLSHNLPFVGAMTFKKSPPHQPCFYTKVEFDKKVLGCPSAWEYGVGEVQGIGMACTLIRREVFEKVEKPWFFPMVGFGEDLSFCIRTRQAGFKIYIDTTLDCGHINLVSITETDYKNNNRRF
jgi:hypothetical protein